VLFGEEKFMVATRSSETSTPICENERRHRPKAAIFKRRIVDRKFILFVLFLYRLFSLFLIDSLSSHFFSVEAVPGSGG
jgi:hypothetical protein